MKIISYTISAIGVFWTLSPIIFFFVATGFVCSEIINERVKAREKSANIATYQQIKKAQEQK